MSTKQALNPHLMSLDLLRGVAALCVVVMHWLDGNGSKAFHYSLLAVDFFFVLSGFVVSYAYSERLKAGMSVGEFMLLRVIRLYPMILVGVVFGVVRYIFKDHFDPGSSHGPAWLTVRAVFNLFMIPSVMDGLRGDMFILNSALWSLFFELVAYLLYAVVLHRLSVVLLWVIVAASGAGVFAWLSDGFSGDPARAAGLFGFIGYPSGAVRVLFAFSLGVLAQKAFRSRKLALRLNGWVAGGLLLAFFALPLGATPALPAFLGILLGFPAIVIGCAGYAGRLALPGLARALGEVSYPVYVIHVPILWLLGGAIKVLRKAPGGGIGVPAIWFGVAFLPMIVALSYILFKAYDAPVRAAIAARLRRRRAAAA